MPKRTIFCLFLAWLQLCVVASSEDTTTLQERYRQKRKQDPDGWWVADLKPVLFLKNPTPKHQRDFTIVAPYSLARLDTLSLVCNTFWEGPLAAAVYLPIFNGTVYDPDAPAFHQRHVSVAILELTKLYHRLQRKNNAAGSRCRLDMAVFSEDLPEISNWFVLPVNSLRNMALAMAQTEVVMLLDADFLPAPKAVFRRYKEDKERYNQLLGILKSKAVVVLPAFEVVAEVKMTAENLTVAQEQAVEYCLGKKDQLFHGWYKRIRDFHPPYHRDTNYTRWKLAKKPYAITYGHTKIPWNRNLTIYEPYVLALRKGFPWWDERFRGYYYNKVQHMWYLHKLGYKYIVHPGIWLMHYPHLKLTDKRKGIMGQRYWKLDSIWKKQMPEAVSRGNYTPVTAAKWREYNQPADISDIFI